jgi:hypothetical protein
MKGPGAQALGDPDTLAFFNEVASGRKSILGTRVRGVQVGIYILRRDAATGRARAVVMENPRARDRKRTNSSL